VKRATRSKPATARDWNRSAKQWRAKAAQAEAHIAQLSIVAVRARKVAEFCELMRDTQLAARRVRR
jgi:hypothetical protein